MVKLLLNKISLLTGALVPFTFSVAQQSLPYSTDFSPAESYVNGNQPNNGWAASDTTIVVTTAESQSDTQSVLIPAASPEKILSLDFDPQSNAIIFVDYYTRLTSAQNPALPLLTTPETSAVVALRSTNLQTAEWIVLDGDGFGSGTWEAAGSIVFTDTNGLSGWRRVSLRMDISSSLWDVYIEGTLIAANLGFAEAMVGASESILFYGNTVGATYFDSFQISSVNPVFSDADSDGIEDSYELTNGMSILVNDRDSDLDLDGLDNIEEYILGLESGNPDTDGDGLLDGFEVAGNYSPLVNDYMLGAFGDLDGDRLANHIEDVAGSSASTPDSSVSLLNTNSISGDDVIILLIGRGAMRINESDLKSEIN